MKVHVQFSIEIPDDVSVSKEDVREAVLYHLHWTNSIAGKHPLLNWQPEPSDEPQVDFDW